MTYRILYQQNFRPHFCPREFTVHLYRNVGASRRRRTHQRLWRKASWSSRWQPFCHAQKSWQNMTITIGHKSHNWCGRSGQARKPLRVEIHGAEQIIFWQPSDVKSTIERNPPSGPSLIAKSRKYYAHRDWTNAVARELSGSGAQK